MSNSRIELNIRDDDDSSCTGVSRQCPPPTVKIEKTNRGLKVFGIVVGNNCQVALPAFGIIFIFIGIILTFVAFKKPDNEMKEGEISNQETSRNLKTLGPVCALSGIGMILLAVILKYMTHKAEDKETRIEFYCPVHGDFYPLSPDINPRKYSFSELAHENKWWMLNCAKKSENVDMIIPADIPTCPHSMFTSNRSSFDGHHVHIINPNSHTVIITTATGDKSPSNEKSEIYGSASSRSLSVPNNVVSFPSYQSKSNPPTSPPSPMYLPPSAAKRLSCPILPQIGAVSPLQIGKLKFKAKSVVASVKSELKVVKPCDEVDESSYQRISDSSINSDEDNKKNIRKSVSILLPPEKYHII